MLDGEPDSLQGRPSTSPTSSAAVDLALSIVRVIRLPHEHKTMLELRLENRGSEPASNITARIIPKAQYKLEEWESPPRRLASLTPQSAQTLEFTIFPEDISARLVEVGIEVIYEAGTVQKAKSFALPVTLAPPRKTFVPIKNPYVAGPPLDPRRSKAVFIGREHTFDSIIDDLHGEFQQNILVLHGERRTGKTSVLLQLCFDRLKPPFHPVFLDMQSFVDVGTYSFLFQMSRRISESLSEQGIHIKHPTRQAFLEGGFEMFNQFLDMVESNLRRGRLVLMLDEFEELEKRVRDRKVDADIFPYLRSQMQHRKLLIFLFAGTHRLEQLSKDYFSIFFNAAIYHEISFLEKSEAEALIVEPVRRTVAYEPGAVESIIDATNCHPYFIQLVCYEVIKRLNQDETNLATPKIIEEVVRQIIRSEVDHLEYLWNQSSEEEHLILSTIAELQRKLPETQYFHYDEIFREMQLRVKDLRPETVDLAIESLSRRRLVEHAPRRETDWGVSFPLLALWIREKHPRIFYHLIK